MRSLALAVVLLVTALLGASGGGAQPTQQPTLLGVIGDEGIVLRDAQGARVTKLDPGTYRLELDDQSDFHNFHLQGPGVDVGTGVEFVGKMTFTITLQDGTYRYVCDVHPVSLRGSFTVGNVPTTPPPTKPPVGTVTSASKLVLTSGPGFTITLKTSAGKTVKSMKTGTYTVVVRDRGTIHDAHLIAPGFDRRTQPLTYTGTQTWKVKLAKPGTLRFLCDPHALQGMKGSARLIR